MPHSQFLIRVQNSKMKAAETVFSLAEVLLLIERGKKNAVSVAFNSNFILSLNFGR